MMKVEWTETSLTHYQWWGKNDKSKVNKIKSLISDIKQTPFSGLGKPEPLKHESSGYWTRRITKEHRLVYKVEDGVITVLSCGYHYE